MCFKYSLLYEDASHRTSHHTKNMPSAAPSILSKMVVLATVSPITNTKRVDGIRVYPLAEVGVYVGDSSENGARGL